MINHRTLSCILFAMWLMLCTSAAGILDESWTYQQMFDEADLVVIATASATKETGEHTKLKVPVKGMETEFETALTLKGSPAVKKFVLHHYDVENEEGDSLEEFPLLVRVDPSRHPTFLLFLKREKDGRYAPATGQTAPAVFSVLRLNGAADSIYSGNGRFRSKGP